MDTEPIVLLIILMFAVWIDVKERRIPNMLIGVGLALALGIAAEEGGWRHVGFALGGIAAGLVLLLPFFLLRLMGAGDVKLMAVVGGFIGVSALLPVALYTFLAGGVLGLVVSGHSRTLRAALENIRLMVMALALTVRGIPVPVTDTAANTGVRLPYSIAIAGGVICWMLTR